MQSQISFKMQSLWFSLFYFFYLIQTFHVLNVAQSTIFTPLCVCINYVSTPILHQYNSNFRRFQHRPINNTLNQYIQI